MEMRWGPGHYFASCTGRAGMTLLLRAMRRLSPAHRTELIVPSYTCYSVPASAVKAGLRVRIVDVDPATLDYDYAQLENVDCDRVLAVVATNLYGLPNDLPRLERLTRERGVMLIDDAAQAMGARVEGRLTGTWGDAGLFSFDKGKSVSSIDGGVVFTRRDDLAQSLQAEWSALSRPPLAATAGAIAKVMVYALMLRPALYAVPANLPFLGLGRTVFTTDFPTERQAAVLAALGSVMLQRLESFTQSRALNARAWNDALGTLDGVRTYARRDGTDPAYVRFPVLIGGPRQRDAVIAMLSAAGIGATGSYPASLADVAELQPSLAAPAPTARGGRLVASQIMTLPTHAFVGAADIARGADMVRRSDTLMASAVQPKAVAQVR